MKRTMDKRHKRGINAFHNNIQIPGEGNFIMKRLHNWAEI